jgi:hypothetical protein
MCLHRRISVIVVPEFLLVVVVAVNIVATVVQASADIPVRCSWAVASFVVVNDDIVQHKIGVFMHQR